MVNPRSQVVAVVDDDASLRRSVKNLLASAGFLVETFESAESFLAVYDSARTGCVVLDLRMPGSSGLELLKHLVAVKAVAPVVVLTAHGDEKARQQCMAAGAAAFLTKPFQADALLGAVEAALGSVASAATDPD